MVITDSRRWYQTIGLHDFVTISAKLAAKTSIQLTSSNARVPANQTNTAWRMVETALDAMGLSARVSIHIEKVLPIQGGLGAGSANAVAALVGLERELGQSLLPGDRLKIAAAVGSDVPLFLLGGTVLGLGRGEQVYPLPDLPSTPCLIAVPEVGVSTPQAFRDWDARYAQPGGAASRLSLVPPSVPNPPPDHGNAALTRRNPSAYT